MTIVPAAPIAPLTPCLTTPSNIMPRQIKPTPKPAASSPKRVLMLLHRVPFPLDRGDRIRSFHILKHLAQNFHVSLACLADEPITRDQQYTLQTYARQFSVRTISHRYSQLRGLASLAAGNPVTPAYFFRRDLAKTICRWHTEKPFDAVFTYCSAMISYTRFLNNFIKKQNPAAQLPRQIIDLVDVDSLKWLHYASKSNPPMSWVYNIESNRIRQIESGKNDHFDAVTLVSTAETNTYRKSVGHHPGLQVLRHGVDPKFFLPLPDPNNKALVFVGTLDYKPNVEGVEWFVRNVMPLLLQRIPNATLKIVGRNPSPKIETLGKHKGVLIVGPVPDVRPYLRDAAVVIAPLFIARGVQSKVLEAMAAARPVVCSPDALEGIFAEEGKHLLVATSAAEWAGHTHRLLCDPKLRASLGHAARTNIENFYAWERCLQPLNQIITGKDQPKPATQTQLKRAA